ncbi:hypothetical protein F0726_02352 [Acidithiobacillus caldus]|nr:hypothetical protein F0726_02352 [Acidithiobacillus caldus]
MGLTGTKYTTRAGQGDAPGGGGVRDGRHGYHN